VEKGEDHRSFVGRKKLTWWGGGSKGGGGQKPRRVSVRSITLLKSQMLGGFIAARTNRRGKGLYEDQDERKQTHRRSKKREEESETGKRLGGVLLNETPATRKRGTREKESGVLRRGKTFCEKPPGRLEEKERFVKKKMSRKRESLNGVQKRMFRTAREKGRGKKKFLRGLNGQNISKNNMSSKKPRWRKPNPEKKVQEGGSKKKFGP